MEYPAKDSTQSAERRASKKNSISPLFSEHQDKDGEHILCLNSLSRGHASYSKPRPAFPFCVILSSLANNYPCLLHRSRRTGDREAGIWEVSINL